MLRHESQPSHFLNALLAADEPPDPDDRPPLSAARGCLVALLPSLLLWAALLYAVSWLAAWLVGLVGVALWQAW